MSLPQNLNFFIGMNISLCTIVHSYIEPKNLASYGGGGGFVYFRSCGASVSLGNTLLATLTFHLSSVIIFPFFWFEILIGTHCLNQEKGLNDIPAVLPIVM